jgi:adenylate kinase
MGLYIILMGVQGAGKGEQAKFISQQYGGIPQVSTGDLFRAMKTRTDDLAQRVQRILAEGKLVDDDTTNEIVRERLEQPDAQNGVILDGYPRTAAQAEWLENYLHGKGETINAVLLLELDLYTAFKRAFGRITSKATGKSYNIYFNQENMEWKFEDHAEGQYPPRLVGSLPDTGEALIRRGDDASAHAIIKRIDTYVETTTPLVDYFDQKGLVSRINADQPIEVVSQDIKAAIDAQVEKTRAQK